MKNTNYTGLSAYDLMCSGWNPTGFVGHQSVMALSDTRIRPVQDLDKVSLPKYKHKRKRLFNTDIMLNYTSKLMPQR